MALEERVAHIEGIVGQISLRFDDLVQRLNSMEADLRAEIRGLRGEIGGLREETRGEIRSLRAEMLRLEERIERNFRWTVGLFLGTLFPMWVTIILTIVFRT